MKYFFGLLVCFLAGGEVVLVHNVLLHQRGRRRLSSKSLSFCWVVGWSLFLPSLGIVAYVSTPSHFILYILLCAAVALLIPRIGIWSALRLKKRFPLLNGLVPDMMDESVDQKHHQNLFFRIFDLGTSFLSIISLLVAILLSGSVLLIGVSALPDHQLDRKIEAAAAVMQKEGNYPTYLYPSTSFQRDNWTEASILDMIYTGNNNYSLESAFLQKQYSSKFPDDHGVGDLLHDVSDTKAERGDYYTRSSYWLGMRIFLIPLLNLFGYETLRPLLLLFCSLIFFLGILKVNDTLGKIEALIYGTSLLLANWFIAVTQWATAFCFLISVFAILWIARTKSNINPCLFFLLLGGETCFFDWFSSPLLTFGLPFSFLLLEKAKCSEKKTFLDSFTLLVKSGVGWCVGYAGMHIGRFVICALLEGNGSMQYFLGRVFYNIFSSGNGVDNSLLEKFQTMILGFQQIFPFNLIASKTASAKVTIFFIISMILLTLTVTVRQRKVNPHFCILFLVSLLPFLWFFVFTGYCRVHYWIAFRVFSLTIFSWMVMLSHSIVEMIQSIQRKIHNIIIICKKKI